MWNKALQNKPKHTWTHELKSNAHLNASIENRLATNNHKSIKTKNKENLRGQKGEKKFTLGCFRQNNVRGEKEIWNLLKEIMMNL